tara:strand:- start:21024 stop:25064 length:4041 start_codon:yes stop_codon:yes gene_type:complete
MKSTVRNIVNSESATPRRSFFKKPAEQSFFQNLQTKLTVGQPGDKYEVEADAMADKVVQRLQQPSVDAQIPFFQSFQGNTALQTKCDSCEEDVQTKENEYGVEATEAIQTNAFIADAPVLGIHDSESKVINTSPVISMNPNTAPTISKSEISQEEEVQTKEEEATGEEKVQLKCSSCEDDVQTKSSVLIQRKGGNASAGTVIESQLSSSKGSGSSLSEPTRNQMESSFGADFSNVKVHTDSNAIAMSQSLNAQAFTHGSDVYFNTGKYDTNSSDGQHLLAHELTHTIQQGAAIQKKEQISTTTPRIQRLFDFDLSSLNEYARYIPGWTLFTVLMGYNPLLGQAVERNAINVLDGLMGLVPLGTLIFNKLQEHNIIIDAYNWTMDLIGELDLTSESVVRTFEEAWEAMDFVRMDPFDYNVGVLTRKFSSLYNRVREFAFRVGDKVFTMIKEVLINTIKSLAAAIPGYTLLTKIIHFDPLTDTAVEATTADIIEEFLLMVGAEQELEKMKETGQLEETATWIDEQLAILDFSLEDITNAFVTAWEAFSPNDLLEPQAALERTVGIFAPFAIKVYTFGSNVVSKVFELIKKYLLGLLKEAANVVPGYHLLTVILEKDPFTEEHVPRTTENLIRGFMGLIPGGETQFQQMKESGAIGRLTDWLDAEVEALGLTWEYIKNMFLEIWDMFTIENLMNPEPAFVQVITRFGEPLGRLIRFVKRLVMKVIEIILELMNFPIDLIRNIIANAQSAFEDIKRDPIGFLKNILRAIKEGFSLFFSNIGAHLLNGITSWLFGQLGEAGITPPADFSFQSILGLVFQILGVTTDRIMEKVAARIGPERMERLRGMADTAMGVWSFVSDVMQRGPVAIWEKIQEKLSTLWDTVLGSIKQWIMTTIIAQVTVRLLSMLDPTGIMAVINGCVAFYNAVQSFIEYLREMLEIVNSFVAGVAEIARGSVNSAAQFLEGALSQAMPIAIGFLANQVGLGSIGRRIGEMITNVREMIDEALDWLVDKAVSAGEGLVNMITGGNNTSESDPAVADGNTPSHGDWRETFTNASGETHTLRVLEKGGQSVLIINPTPIQEATTFLNSAIVNQQDPQVISAKRLAEHINWQLHQSNTREDQSVRDEVDANIDKLAAMLSRIRISSGMLPTGRSRTDAIPIAWYKDTSSDYPPTVTLEDGLGNIQTFSFQGGVQQFILDENKLRGRRGGTLSTVLDGLYSTGELPGGFPKYYVELGLNSRYLVREGSVLTKSGSYRNVFAGRYQRAFRGVLIEHGYAGSGWDADHVQDLQFGGPDDFMNLWPLNSAINQSSLRFADQSVDYLDDNGNLVTTNLFDENLRNRYFIVDRFQHF